MKQNLLQTTSLSLTSLFAILFAVTPSFAMGRSMNAEQGGRCPNPGGNQIVNFQDGWHAIVGFSQNLWGKDTVNDIGNQNFVQCFCPLPHDNQAKMDRGIQTSWMSVGNVNSSEQQQLLNSGWQLRHDGTSFGLPQNDFFVKNFSFSCKKIESESKIIKNSSEVRVIESNNGHISTSITDKQNTGGNSVSRNTEGNTEIITGNVSSDTDISTSVNSNENSLRQKVHNMVERIRVSISGNGSTSENRVNISSH